MYAHQVIDCLKKYRKVAISREQNNIRTGFTSGFLSFAIKTIQKAQKFHAEADYLRSTVELTNKKIFLDDCKYIRLPYPICWFDWLYNIEFELQPGDYRVPKRGLLVIGLKLDLLLVFVFNYSKNYSEWMPGLCSYLVSIGKTWDERDDLNDLGMKYSEDMERSNCYVLLADPFLVLPNGVSEGNIKLVSARDDQSDLTCLQSFLLLLACKNITTCKELPSIQLNKKRIESGKTELFSYHTLVIKKHDVFKKYPKLEALSHNRIHLCRGHFKEYTEEHPLFGKIVGLWWWNPHVRGQNKEGIVIKDYKVAQSGSVR